MPLSNCSILIASSKSFASSPSIVIIVLLIFVVIGAVVVITSSNTGNEDLVAGSETSNYEETEDYYEEEEEKYTIKIEEDELREALIKLYESTNGDNWTRNDNWCSDKPVEEWYGVNLSQKKQTISLLSGDFFTIK